MIDIPHQRKQYFKIKVGSPWVHILFLGILICGSHSLFAQNLVKNSSFEDGDAPWLSEGDKMERHHTSVLRVIPMSGEYYAELASDSGYRLYQDIIVETGSMYRVSFYAQARPKVTELESQFVFQIDDQLTANIAPVLGTWQQYSYTVKAEKNSLTLSFEDTYYGKDGIGAMIDDVAIEKIKQDFISIFNGQTLDGWKVYGSPSDIAKNYWKVEDQNITCNTLGDKDHDAVWLFYEEELEDFELKLKFRAYRDSPGNSGLQVRSRYYEGGDIDGPQLDIHPPGPFRTALLYDETDGYDRWIYPSMPSPKLTPEEAKNQSVFYYADDDLVWNELHVTCIGTTIKSVLNGTVVTDFDGKGILDDEIHLQQNVGMSGKIALQVHGKNEIRIDFKDIELKQIR